MGSITWPPLLSGIQSHLANGRSPQEIRGCGRVVLEVAALFWAMALQSSVTLLPNLFSLGVTAPTIARLQGLHQPLVH